MNEAQANLLNSNLATNQQLAAVESNLLERMETNKAELVKWMAGMMIGMTIGMAGVLVALVKFL